MKILTSKNIYTEIDDDDFLKIKNKRMHAHPQKSGGHYITIMVNGKGVPLHRYLMGMPDKKFDIDHINGIKEDNRKCNLRVATRSQNIANSKKSRGTSKYKGVSFCKQTGKWRSSIEYRLNGKRKSIHIGRYSDEAEAALKYNEMAIKIFKTFARLNCI